MYRTCFLLICAFFLTAGIFAVSSATAETLLYSDTFESGMGNWSNTGSGDTNDWTRYSGRTPTYWTGPSGGATSTYYMYMETSSGSANAKGDSAILLGPSITEVNIRVTFNYHMYGSTMGTLSLDVLSEGSWINDVWSLSGQKQTRANAAYIQADVDLSAYSVSQLRFRGTAAGGVRGDMAIDTIEIWGTPLSDLDTDNDGVTDDLDSCPGTTTGEAVDSNGCADSQKDTDNDGVTDDLDNCANTPHGELIDSDGCSESQKDSDNDGVTDDVDTCPATPSGETVDAEGCSDYQIAEKDTDGDGTNDLLDKCPTDSNKTEPGDCGCGIVDRDYNSDGIPECAEGDIYVISSTSDDLTAGSLRKAIIDANATDGADMIILQNNATYTLNLSGADEDASTTGDLDINDNVEIVGNNAVIDAAGIDRVFHISSGVHVTIRDLTIKGGQTVNGHGGGFYVDQNATLIMENCVVTENNVTGSTTDGWSYPLVSHGGGIYVDLGGTLSLKSCTISYNQTGSSDLNLSSESYGGFGGGIYAVATSVDLESCLITHNRTGDGNGYGAGGEGGGLYLYCCGARLDKCIISNNTTGSGYGDTVIGGNGGGMVIAYGNAVLDMCTIQSNVTGRGNNGGNSGSGGGIYACTGKSLVTLTIENSTISNNQTGMADGQSGHGGGIYASERDGMMKMNMMINNSSISGNTTGDGAIAGNGAGLFNLLGNLKINNTTITLNSGGSSSSLNSIDSCSDVNSAYGGGGLFNSSGTMEFKNTIVAGNTVEIDNCGQDGRNDGEGSVISHGYNIIGNDAAWSLTSDASDIIGTSTSQVDPGLAQLADNGGETQTHALNPGSPAIDAGDCLDMDSNPVLYDQRGYSRDDGLCDIGAVEMQ